MSLAREFESFPRNLALVVVFNTMVAFGLTAANPTDVFENFVRSQCIGLSILVAIDPAARLLWRGRAAPRKPLLALIAAGTLLGLLVGNWLSAALLGGAERSLPWATREQRAMLAVTVFASAAAAWYFWNRGRIVRLKLTAEALQRQGSEAQLRLQQAQIEPQFLFDQLAATRGFIARDTVRAQRMLDQLDEYLRASVQAVRKPEITLADEFALIQRYLELTVTRLGDRFSWSLDLPPALQGRAVPPMLLQPLVDNAVKHGIEPKLDSGRIEVRAHQDATRLTLEVADTGVGLGAAAPSETGLGLDHIHKRLAASYGSAARLTLEERAPSGVLTKLELPPS